MPFSSYSSIRRWRNSILLHLGGGCSPIFSRASTSSARFMLFGIILCDENRVAVAWAAELFAAALLKNGMLIIFKFTGMSNQNFTTIKNMRNLITWRLHTLNMLINRLFTMRNHGVSITSGLTSLTQKDLPFSFRQRIREELSLDMVMEAWNRRLAGSSMFEKVLSQWQKLVASDRAFQGYDFFRI